MAGTLYWVAYHWHNPIASSLTTGLQGNWETAEQVFNRRAMARFPIGSPTSAMTIELANEGFVPTDWEAAPGRERSAERDESAFPCKTTARIYWRDDGSGRLAGIRGTYRQDACL